MMRKEKYKLGDCSCGTDSSCEHRKINKNNSKILITESKEDSDDP